MKKKTLFIIFSFFFSFLLLVSCQKKENRTISNVYLLGSENEKCYLNEEYDHSNVKVYVDYTDSTKSDVTSLSKFSTPNTNSIGKKEVTVTYLEYILKYEVEVIDLYVESITIDTSNVKQLFNVGEYYSFENLKVKAHYSNQTEKFINDYNIKITDSNNSTINKDNPFTKTGYYDVEISVGEIKATYRIGVYNTMSSTRYYLRPESINNKYKMVNSNYIFKSGEVVLRSKEASLTIVGNENRLTSNDINGFALSVKDKNITYNTAFRIPKLDDDKNALMLYAQTQTWVLIKTSNNQGLIIVDEQGVPLQTIYTKSDNMYYMFVSINGNQKYEIISSDKDSLIYDIMLERSGEEVIQFSKLSLDIQDAKLNYKDNEVLSLDKVRLYGIRNEQSYPISFSNNEVLVNIYYQDRKVDRFLLSGKYKIELVYNGKYPSLQYVISYEIDYVYNNQDSDNQIKRLVIDNKEITMVKSKYLYELYTSNSKVNVIVEPLEKLSSIYVNSILYSGEVEIELVDGKNSIFVMIIIGSEEYHYEIDVIKQ